MTMIKSRVMLLAVSCLSLMSAALAEESVDFNDVTCQCVQQLDRNDATPAGYQADGVEDAGRRLLLAKGKGSGRGAAPAQEAAPTVTESCISRRFMEYLSCVREALKHSPDYEWSFQVCVDNYRQAISQCFPH